MAAGTSSQELQITISPIWHIVLGLGRDSDPGLTFLKEVLLLFQRSGQDHFQNLFLFSKEEAASPVGVFKLNTPDLATLGSLTQLETIFEDVKSGAAVVVIPSRSRTSLHVPKLSSNCSSVQFV